MCFIHLKIKISKHARAGDPGGRESGVAASYNYYNPAWHQDSMDMLPPIASATHAQGSAVDALSAFRLLCDLV